MDAVLAEEDEEESGGATSGSKDMPAGHQRPSFDPNGDPRNQAGGRANPIPIADDTHPIPDNGGELQGRPSFDPNQVSMSIEDFNSSLQHSSGTAGTVAGRESQVSSNQYLNSSGSGSRSRSRVARIFNATAPSPVPTHQWEGREWEAQKPVNPSPPLPPGHLDALHGPSRPSSLLEAPPAYHSFGLPSQHATPSFKLRRMPSSMWLKEPAPERRPTM